MTVCSVSRCFTRRPWSHFRRDVRVRRRLLNAACGNRRAKVRKVSSIKSSGKTEGLLKCSCG